MKTVVLDSYALLAYCEGEKGAGKVAHLFKQALGNALTLSLCVVNWGEMLYIALRECGEKAAENYCAMIAKYPIEVVPADEALTRKAAHYKANYKMSYADAFAAALASVKKASLATGDPEFKALERELDILWLE